VTLTQSLRPGSKKRILLASNATSKEGSNQSMQLTALFRDKSSAFRTVRSRDLSLSR
jgi:hypothetical protein